jgi:Fe-S oxidoreductase
MSLADYQRDMETCCRCSACKFVPFEKVQGFHNVNVCPSIARYNFHAYSGGGRLGIGVAMLENELDYSDKLLEVVYNCQMCGACDVSCKYAMDMEVLEPINEMRIECVESGHTIPIFDEMVSMLRTEGRMVPDAETGPGHWYDGLDVKEVAADKTETVYHAGCRTAHDPAMWKVARSIVTIMRSAGIDVGILGAEEGCCGGRAYQIGYKTDFIRQAENNMDRIKQSGVKTVVTGCAECYHAFKVLYDKFDLKGDLEVLHTTEYFARLIQEGKLTCKKNLDLKVTYHDPCHLGRLGEPYIHWDGKEIPGQIRLFDPPKEFRRGSNGVYEPPRAVLTSIPGVRLTEMKRIKEYAWCCGAGGGVKEGNSEFAQWTAKERIEEAAATGAEAIVTACPGCEKIFLETVADQGKPIKVYDVVELINQAVS